MVLRKPPAIKKKKKPRNYRKEYDNYHGKPEQIKRRDSRNAARNSLKKAGVKVAGKDVAHKNGNPRDNRPKNLALKTPTKNRSCLLYTSPSPRDGLLSRMPSSA